MSVMRTILRRSFGRPEGLLGRLGGIVMARTNAACGAWIADLLDVGASDSILEVGFGPGVIVRLLSARAAAGQVAGIDPSQVMLEQASARNEAAIRAGRVDLRRGTVEQLPFDADSFDKALAINSMQIWPDAGAGLREMRRVLKPGGRIVLGFTPHSGQRRSGLIDLLAAAGFADARLAEAETGFCVMATKPQ